MSFKPGYHNGKYCYNDAPLWRVPAVLLHVGLIPAVDDRMMAAWVVRCTDYRLHF